MEKLKSACSHFLNSEKPPTREVAILFLSSVEKYWWLLLTPAHVFTHTRSVLAGTAVSYFQSWPWALSRPFSFHPPRAYQSCCLLPIRLWPSFRSHLDVNKPAPATTLELRIIQHKKRSMCWIRIHRVRAAVRMSLGEHGRGSHGKERTLASASRSVTCSRPPLTTIYMTSQIRNPNTRDFL